MPVDRGLRAGYPRRTAAAGLVTLGELDLLAQRYGLQIEPGGRITPRAPAAP